MNNENAVLNVEDVVPFTNVTNTQINRLASGETLSDSEMIYSPEKHSVLRLKNGQLSLYINFKRVWSTPTRGSGATKLVNQTDGNLVLYTDDGKVAWASNTNGRGGSTLSLQIDGNLVLYAGGTATWSSNTPTENQLLRVNAAIRPDQTLFVRQQLSTRDRKGYLILQQDGNLVLYNKNKVAIWASNTNGKGATSLNMQQDGNLVLYTDTNKAVWASNTDSGFSSFLTMQEDLNLVLYKNLDSVWATGTAGR